MCIEKRLGFLPFLVPIFRYIYIHLSILLCNIHVSVRRLGSIHLSTSHFTALHRHGDSAAVSHSRKRRTQQRINPCWTTPVSASVHCWTIPASHNSLGKLAALLNVPQLLYSSTDLFQILCVCRLNTRLLQVFQETALLWKQTSCQV